MRRDEAEKARVRAVRRRGAAAVIVVVILALTSLVVVTAVAGGEDDAQVAALRVETLRAFYAAESGGVIVFKAIISGATLPSDGDEVTIGSQTIEFVRVPPTGVGEVTIEGRAGLARRRLTLEVE